jgi:acyl carrier protein
MKESDVIQALCETLAELQNMGGREPVQISATTCPIGDLPDFDSLNGVEASVALEGRLGVQLNGVNIFVNESGSRALTISEVAKRICVGNGSKSDG